MAPPRRYPHRERMCGQGRMRQFTAYVSKTLHLAQLARKTIRDSRRDPTYEGYVCFLLTVVMLLRRQPSFNSFEDLLQDPPMKKLFRQHPLPRCTQTLKDALKKMHLASLEALHQQILKSAAQNKVFAKTRMNGLRALAFDGVEPLSSRKRSCPGCQTRTLNTAQGPVQENYHRLVMLQSIGPHPHLLLGFQAQASLSQRKIKNAEAKKAEGELTAVKPLLQRLRQVFPRLFHLGLGDALYANGPMFALLRQGPWPMDLIAVLKKERDEPLADALTVFQNMPPTKTYYDHQRQEHVRLWDSEGFESLGTCPYPLRVIKALVLKGPEKNKPRENDWTGERPHTWCMGTGLKQEKLAGSQVFDVLRHRWDEENCAFNELTQHWHFKHSYLHHDIGTQAMFYAFLIAYNIFQLFLHGCLRHFAFSRITAVRIADQMRRDYATITDPRDGFFPFDTS